MKDYFLIALGLIFMFTVAACTASTPLDHPPSALPTEEEKKAEELEGIKRTSEGVKYIVHPDDILSGGPPKDGIPSIDDPKYITVEEADEWIEDNEWVLAFQHKGEKRVYPLQILVFHEIVNDYVAGDPILITYCPLCGTGIAYERTINGEVVEFGTSGKLYNSNLVMYDRKTDSYWQQIDGKAIVGEHVGLELTELSIDTVLWRDWKDIHPDSEVLSKDTGHRRNYGEDPYGSYYEDSYVIFPIDHENNVIHPKEIIHGIEIDGKYKAYRDQVLDHYDKEIIDKFNGINIKVTKDDTGVVTVINTDTNEEIVKERGFWFSWYAFHPDTELHEAKKRN